MLNLGSTKSSVEQSIILIDFFYEIISIGKKDKNERSRKIIKDMGEDIKITKIEEMEGEKIILTMDKSINNDYNGIKVINIIDWLLKW